MWDCRFEKDLEHAPIKLDRIMLYLSFVSAFSEPADDAICFENALGYPPWSANRQHAVTSAAGTRFHSDERTLLLIAQWVPDGVYIKATQRLQESQALWCEGSSRKRLTIAGS